MLKKLRDKLLTFFGDIKVFKYPFWIVYDPEQYFITGDHLREIENTIQPGDIVCRGYRSYLDGKFIPGKFSHSGIYVGNHTVIHAVAEGVEKIDILTFCQCDCVAIIRPKVKSVDLQYPTEWYVNRAIERARSYLGRKYDFGFTAGDDALYCHELSASCYDKFGIEKKIARLPGFLKFIKKKEPVYLAESFMTNANLEVVLTIDNDD